MTFSPTQKLEVWRTLSNSKQVLVGTMAQNSKTVYFQYATEYLQHYESLSPFQLAFNSPLQQAPKTPHNGLHGVFSDSLPDGWGTMLQDRCFRQRDILPSQVTAMDRLAFVGASGSGALSYRPTLDFNNSHNTNSLAQLGLQAQALYDGQTDTVLQALVAAGSSGGARPKALIYTADNGFQHCRTQAQPGDSAWLIKFTSSSLPLGHEEGICEATYLDMAKYSGLDVPQYKLLPAPAHSGADQWLALARFDCIQLANDLPGRTHMLSASGLLDADYRTPSMDYLDLIKASATLCRSPAAAQIQFKRAMFNLFSCNHDDHSKNWSFLLQDNGHWTLAPFYDVTFSPHPFGEHATAFRGHGKNPPKQAINQLIRAADFVSTKHAQQTIQEVVESIGSFDKVAHHYGVTAATRKLITKQLNATWQANKHLLE